MGTSETKIKKQLPLGLNVKATFLITVLVSLLALGMLALFKPGLLESVLSVLEGAYGDMLEEKFSESSQTNPLLLPLFAFVGGILGSVSPCILAMLPMNLAYIGTLKVENRFDAIKKAGAFVSGVVLVTSLFGLISGFASAVMVQYKGYFYVSVAIFILIMAAAMLEWVRITLPQGVSKVPSAGPFIVGTAFALISSPCASPVLFGVLALASTSGSVVLSVSTMAAYGLGYTAIIFFASIFTGLSKQLNFLKYHGQIVNRVSGIVLLLAGLGAFYQGLRWFMA